jgi:hypothetical protein
MNKNQISCQPGRQLSKQNLKQLKGGIGSTLWVCIPYQYDCYHLKSDCLAYCAYPGSCIAYNNTNGCP